MSISTGLGAKLATSLTASNLPLTVSGPTTAGNEIEAAVDGWNDSAGKRIAKPALGAAIHKRTSRKSWALARGWIGKEITKPPVHGQSSRLTSEYAFSDGIEFHEMMKDLKHEESILNAVLKPGGSQQRVKLTDEAVV